MDKKKSYLNIITAMAFKIILVVLTIFTRKFLIEYCGEDVNGLNSLFLSIIGVLSVAELGIGSAITFCMYKPIVDGDTSKVSALYFLFNKLYKTIGVIILLLGLCVIPLLSFLAKGYQVDFYTIVCFVIILISTVSTYLFSSKTSLINAYKNNYITTTITSLGSIILNILQITILILTKSFMLYLLMRIISVIIQWILTDIYTKKKHREIIANRYELDNDTYINVKKNIKAMFMHRIGGVLVLTCDSLIISAFISVNDLGKYSNYILIMTSMSGIIALFSSPLTTIIGHLYVSKTKEKTLKFFNFFYLFNMSIGFLFYLGYYAVINQIIYLWIGEQSIMDKLVVIVITLNYFIIFVRQSVLTFRDATGTFYNDRYKPLVEGIINIVLSIAFVNWFGIVGVIGATILTNIFITHIVEPHVLFKYGFDKRATRYYIINYCFLGLFTMVLFLYDKVNVFKSNNLYKQLLVNGFISVGISMVVIVAIYIIFRDFRMQINSLLKEILYKKKIK